MHWSQYFYKKNLKDDLSKLTKYELNTIDEDGYSLLSYSLIFKDADFVEYLLKDLKLDPQIKAHTLGGKKFVNDIEQVPEKNPMWKAALNSEQNSMEKIKLLHQYGADLEQLDDEGYSLLSESLIFKDADLVEYLLKDLKINPQMKANCLKWKKFINGEKQEPIKDPMWKAALHSKQNAMKKIKLLQQYGSDLEELDEGGLSALTWVIANQDSGMSLLPLLPYMDLNKKEYIVEARDRGENNIKETPLFWAIHYSQSNNAMLLIEAGADIDTKDKFGNNAIHLSSQRGLLEVVSALIMKGLDINERDKKELLPLHTALMNLDAKLLQLLLEKGADKNSVLKKDYFTFEIGHFILFSIILNNTNQKELFKNVKEVMEIFPDAITNKNYKQIFLDLKPYIARLFQDFIDISEMDINIKSYFEVPVVVDVITFAEKIISILVDYIESSKNCLQNKCQGDLIPLEFYAAIKGDEVIISRLLAEKPELINGSYKGISLFSLATILCQQEITKLLISYDNFDFNAVDEEGNNVLSVIITLKDIDLIKDLLTRGVDIDAINNKYVSAADKILHIIGQYQYDEAVALVSKYSKDDMHQLMVMGEEYKNFKFEANTAYVGIATADQFWSTEHFSMARRVMENHNNLKIIVLNENQEAEDFLTKFNGFILPGGADSYPKEQEFGLTDIKIDRMLPAEMLYKYILSVADQYSIPVMGMCLGNQYIGLHGGAMLHHTKGHFGGNHNGIFIKGTMPYFMSLSAEEQYQLLDTQYYPHIEFAIHTYHNFAVLDSKPGDLTIGGNSEAGVVQSISYKNHIIGFQFHPENLYSYLELGENAVRSTNLIDNFMSLSTQHYKWHSFAQRGGFSAIEAQNALKGRNDNLLGELSAGAKDGCCMMKELYQQCNITREEFSWPEPELDFFKIGVCAVTANVCRAALGVFDALAEEF